MFLSVGRSDLAAFAGQGQWFLVRTIEPAERCLANARWLAERGPFRIEDELALLREHAIDVVVTKASGGEATYAKLAAARQLGLPVIMVRRPPPPAGPLVDSVAAALAWLGHRLGTLRHLGRPQHVMMVARIEPAVGEGLGVQGAADQDQRGARDALPFRRAPGSSPAWRG